MKAIDNKSGLILAFLAVFSIIIGMGCIAAANADHVAADNLFANDSGLAQNSSGSGIVVDDNNDFTMSVKYNTGTGYHWVVSSETHGVDISGPNYVADHPGACGSSGTAYFNVHVINGDDYYVKLVLVSPSGDIVDEVDSNMIN